MASNGLINKAKTGTCRMCLRRRCTEKYVSPVAEVHHGFATGYVWECNDIQDCESEIKNKLNKYPKHHRIHQKILTAINKGRMK